MKATPEAPSLNTLPGAPVASLATPAQVSERLQVPQKTLAVWRSTNRVRLPFVKVGGAVRYRWADIEQFVASNTHATVQA